MTAAGSSVKRLLFVSFSNPGDAILSLPALEAAISAFPEASVDVVCGPSAASIFQNDPRVRTVHVDPKRPFVRRLQLFKKIRAEGYDRVIDLRRSLFGWLGKPCGPVWSGGGEHMRDRHLNLVRALGVNVEPFRFGPVRSSDPGALTGRTAVIAPGSKSSTKEWLPERFAALADRLIRDEGLDVIWIGSEGERARVDAIRERMGEPSANLAGRVSWGDSMELIRAAAITVTNDSAPLHASDHIGKKTVAIFGPTSPLKYGPQRSAEGVVFKGVPCSPCGEAQCRYGHRRCLTEITVEDVYRRVKDLLDDLPERSGPNILIVRLDRIGDAALSFPAVTAVRAKYPNARITWLVRPAVRELVERCPDSDEVIEYDYSKKGRHRGLLGWLSLVRQLRRRGFDMTFVLHPTARSHVTAAASGIPYRAGYSARGGWMLTHRIQDLRRDGYQHESRYAQDVVRALGIPSTDAAPRLLLYREDHLSAEALLRRAGADPERPYAVFHAGSSSESKCWPREHFLTLAREFAAKGCQVVWTGDGSTRQINAWLAERVASSDLTGLTSVPALGALCRNAVVTISNDSGPAHVAAAAGARVLSLFGRKEPGLSERRWAPLGADVRALRKDVGCVVCLADRCPIGFECLRALEPGAVWEAASELIARASQAPNVRCQIPANQGE
jgi:lipopolysaccharide heptosyltransferase II